MLINFIIRAGITTKTATALRGDAEIELGGILLNRCRNHHQILIRTIKINTAQQPAERGPIGVLIREKAANPKTKVQLVER